MKSWISQKRPDQTVRMRRTYVTVQQKKRPVLRVLRAVILIAIITVPLYLLNRFFRIQEITCIGQPACTDADWEIARRLEGRLILGQLTLDHPGKVSTIRKKYPHSVVVEMHNLSVAAIVYADDAQTKKMIILSDGTLYDGDEKDLQNGIPAQVTLIDHRIEQAEHKTIVPQEWRETYQKLLTYAQNNSVNRILIKNDTEVHLQFADELVAIMTLANSEEQLRSLQLLLSSPTIDSRPAQVDLRFAHPVLRIF